MSYGSLSTADKKELNYWCFVCCFVIFADVDILRQMLHIYLCNKGQIN